MKGFLRFIQYHNAVPIALGVLFLGAGSAFAMSPEIREAVGDAVYESETQIITIDNTYIANKDLESYTPRVQITSVTEDDEFYYVEYTLSTIDLAEHVWQDLTKSETMNVSKIDLGEYRDLGLYVTEQLGQVIARELAYLKEVQAIERRSITQKTVATKYSGLVGAMLSDTTETLPGYTPVVTPPTSGPGSVAQGNQQDGQNSSQAGSSPQTNSALALQVIGANPARIPLRSSYSDLGAIVTLKGAIVDFSIKTFLDGKEVRHVSIDTSESARYIVTYRSQDNNGNEAEIQRVVLVGDAELGDADVPTSNIPITQPQEEEESTDAATTTNESSDSTDATTDGDESGEAAATTTSNGTDDSGTDGATATTTTATTTDETNTGSSAAQGDDTQTATTTPETNTPSNETATSTSSTDTGGVAGQSETAQTTATTTEEQNTATTTEGT